MKANFDGITYAKGAKVRLSSNLPARMTGPIHKLLSPVRDGSSLDH